jgi:hypothetical protein
MAERDSVSTYNDETDRGRGAVVTVDTTVHALARLMLSGEGAAATIPSLPKQPCRGG